MTRIENLLPSDWPPEVTAGLEAWHQGQLIERPAFFWEASSKTPLLPFVAQNGDKGRESQVFSLPPQMRPPYGVVVSQTCDIFEARPTNPFVNVAPVVDLKEMGDGEKKAIREHKYVDYVYLTAQPAEDGFYVVDLRIFLPIEKGLLAARTPIDGFKSESDRLDFAERLAGRLRRPSYSDAVQDLLIRPLNKWITDNAKAALKEGSGCFTDVEEVRLRIDGDRLSPRSVQLVVFQETLLDRADKKVWRDWRNSNHKAFKNETGVTFRPVQFSSLTKMNASDYRLLSPVWLSALGRGSQF